MKLTVKNFGPIREARNIDISPMTIFVGPSNTGKSYLAMLIYSIFKVITDDEFARRGLLLEEIRMGSGADQVQFTSFYAINQKPVRFDMDFPVTLPNPA